MEPHASTDSVDHKNNWATEMEGQVIEGRLKIVRLLASGGMGSVFVADDLQSKKQVALKILSVAPQPRQIARFLREARLASQLNHPSIVRILSFGQSEGLPFITMEHLEGRTLRDALAEGPLDFEFTRRLGMDICGALAHAHEKRIVHRDIKPSNIFLVAGEERDHAVLLDFGVAKFLDESGQRLTHTGVMVGTPGYLSPEQCSNSTVDQRADLYSLGCVLYECLSGVSPFKRETPLGVMMAHLHEEPDPLPSELPAWLSALTMSLLRKSPGERPASANDVLRCLENEQAPEVVHLTAKKANRSRATIGSRALVILSLVTLVIVAGLWIAMTRYGVVLDTPQQRTYDSLRQSASRAIKECKEEGLDESKFSEAKDAIKQADGIAAGESERDLVLFLARLQEVAELNSSLADLLPDGDRRKFNLYAEAASKLDRAHDVCRSLNNPDLENVSAKSLAAGRRVYELANRDFLSADKPVVMQFAETALKHAAILCDQGRYLECVPLLDQAKDIRERFVPFTFSCFTVYSFLADVNARVGRNEEAAKYCALASRIIPKISIGRGDEGKISSVSDCLLRLTHAEIILKDYTAAAKFAKFGIDGFEIYFTAPTPGRKHFYPRLIAKLAEVRMLEGKLSEAKALIKRAHDLDAEFIGGKQKAGG